ncbi:MAG: hypothetical protein EON58_22135, partial [Alphaproteobacteria bacterium]
MKILTKWLGGATILGAVGLTALTMQSIRDAKAESSAQAPELVGNQWFNTPDGKPLTLASRRGKVTVVEF